MFVYQPKGFFQAVIAALLRWSLKLLLKPVFFRAARLTFNAAACAGCRTPPWWHVMLASSRARLAVCPANGCAGAMHRPCGPAWCCTCTVVPTASAHRPRTAH